MTRAIDGAFGLCFPCGETALVPIFTALALRTAEQQRENENKGKKKERKRGKLILADSYHRHRISDSKNAQSVACIGMVPAYVTVHAPGKCVENNIVMSAEKPPCQMVRRLLCTEIRKAGELL